MVQQSFNQFVFYLSTLAFTTDYALGRIFVFFILFLKGQLNSCRTLRNKQAREAKMTIFMNLLLRKRTPLDTAIRFNDLELVKYFIELIPENVNMIITDAGSEPLHIGAFSGTEEICNFLLQNGANVNSSNFYGVTPLHLADNESKLEIVKLLIQHGADMDAKEHRLQQTPLHFAVSEYKLKLAKILIQNGADVNAKQNKGFAPLHIAIDKGNMAMTKLLVENGAIIDSIDNIGLTPFRYAFTNNWLEAADFLIQNGANIDAKGHRGWTALHHAIKNKEAHWMNYLMLNGASVNVKNFEGFTPIEYRLEKKDLTSFKMMVMYQQSEDDCMGKIQAHCITYREIFSFLLVLFGIISFLLMMIHDTQKDVSCTDHILQCMATDDDFCSFSKKKFLMYFHCDKHIYL